MDRGLAGRLLPPEICSVRGLTHSFTDFPKESQFASRLVAALAVHIVWLCSLARADFARQAELKRCTPSWVRSDPQAAPMRFDDGPADGQSHPGSLRLGGKECIEDLLRLSRL